MKFTPAQIRELATNTRFPAENLEKVLRLRELLIEFHKHTYLRGKLVLKGGTALNFFYLNLTRLSVDIDLNYVGYIDREATLRDRLKSPELSSKSRPVSATGFRMGSTTTRCGSGTSISRIMRTGPTAFR
jgi:predicted nucleotidyltransferase component of viral defense system